ncbi:hypothetical protein SAMN05518672_115119 [Chitinophaga sp. CF118]|uniref:MauE/DoxX family redox-associated membrane protein n=1 Tax=Chitinophaga sp. CF118 TaxID=1884367 RepID=UPI0008F23001|nr:hypothetical protein SAMN05518672_115119 [Chitinophaga sp. CF118]
MKGATVIETICSAFFLLFVYTSISKLISYDYYLYDLRRSPLLASYATVISITVPCTEIIVAALLIPNKTRKYGLLGSLVLMLVFTVYVAYVLLFTTKRPCTCGGIIRQLSWPDHLIFNISFLLLAITGIILQIRYKRTL